MDGGSLPRPCPPQESTAIFGAARMRLWFYLIRNRCRRHRMRLEYFFLIDRIVELNLDEATIRSEAIVPTASTIFEGHFPGYPLMPGVLLIETMAQTSGWLLIALRKFTRMPFFAAVKEAKLRTFVKPGEALAVSAKVLHDGSGFARTAAEIRRDGKLVCNAELTFRLVEFPSPDFRVSMEKFAAEIAFPKQAMADA
jgi:3-hydroxyacyl-[acyl-carrier-protein] dehydratase